MSAWTYGPTRSSDTNFSYTAWLRPGLEECPAFLVVGHGHAELGVRGGLDRGIRLGEQSGDVAQAYDHGLHVVDGELGGRLDAEQVLESSFVLDRFAHPLADLGRSDGLLAQHGSVSLDFRVHFRDPVAHLLTAGCFVGVDLALCPAPLIRPSSRCADDGRVLLECRDRNGSPVAIVSPHGYTTLAPPASTDRPIERTARVWAHYKASVVSFER